MQQLWVQYDHYHASVLAVERVPDEKVGDCGIIAGPEVEPGLFRCERLVEKPKLAEAPSRLGITGAYVPTREVYEAIDRTKPGVSGEVQLTDALQLLSQDHPVYATTFKGTRYDIGDRYLWLKTNLEFAMHSPELRKLLRPILVSLLEGE